MVEVVKKITPAKYELTDDITKALTTGSTFAIAYCAHKFTAPIRLGFTLVAVPQVVRYLRKIGIFKQYKRTGMPSDLNKSKV